MLCLYLDMLKLKSKLNSKENRMCYVQGYYSKFIEKNKREVYLKNI